MSFFVRKRETKKEVAKIVMTTKEQYNKKRLNYSGKDEKKEGKYDAL